jgi:hypothetical protein
MRRVGVDFRVLAAPLRGDRYRTDRRRDGVENPLAPVPSGPMVLALEASIAVGGRRSPRNRRLLAAGMAFWSLVLLGAVGPLAESPASQANPANASV